MPVATQLLQCFTVRCRVAGAFSPMELHENYTENYSPHHAQCVLTQNYTENYSLLRNYKDDGIRRELPLLDPR